MVVKNEVSKYENLMVKSNYIIEASYKLNLQEQRLIYLLTTKISKDDEKFNPYRFKPAEVNNILTKHKVTLNELRQYISSLRNRELVIIKQESTLETKWLSSAEYFSDGSIELCFDDKLRPYLLQLKERFTKLSLDKVITFNSNYSCRIYELLKQYESIGERIISIEKLRDMFCIEPEEYRLYGDFKRKIILQAQKEINNKTDLSFDFEEIKTGRKVTSIKFITKSNIKGIDEVCATNEDKCIIEEENCSIEPINEIKAIFKNIVDYDLSDKSANEVLKCAKRHKEYGGNPLELIKEVAEYSKTQNIDKNFIGWFKNTVSNYEKPRKAFLKDTFSNYEQRTYDFDVLERKLLGWDNTTDEVTEESYLQGAIKIDN